MPKVKQAKEIKKPKTTRLKSRNWCFTINDDIDNFKIHDSELVRYYVFQKEKAPTTGHLHLQGFIQVKDNLTLGQIKKILGGKAHVEKMKGTIKQATEYCKKSETAIAETLEEYGVPVDQGQREDLRQIYVLCKEQRPMDEIIDSHPGQYMRYGNYIDKIYQRFRRKRIPSVTFLNTFVLVGPPNTDKTRCCVEYDKDAFKMMKTKKEQTTIWFDGYEGQKTLIIDDFRGHIPYDMLLEFLDVYKMTLQVKGGTTQKEWDTVFITSNMEPKEWYQEGLTDALAKRLTGVIMTKPGDTYHNHFKKITEILDAKKQKVIDKILNK